MFTTIIIFVLVLSILVFVHEFGHFIVTRKVGARAEEFGFGLPPRIIGFYHNSKGQWKRVVGNRSIESLDNDPNEDIRPRKGSTVYSLNWLPIGGFVKIKGENDNGLQDPDSFSAQSIGRRILILSAGVIMNILLAWFIFSVGYMVGLPQSTNNVSDKATVINQQVVVAQVLDNSPAKKVGLQADDIILQANDKKIKTQADLQEITNSNVGKEIDLKINRKGEIKDIMVTPELNKDHKGQIGVAIISGGLVRYPFFSAIWEGTKTTFFMLKEIIVMFFALIVGLFTGNGMAAQVSGPVGIAKFTGQMAHLGLAYLAQFTAFLSLNLAVLNFIPFPALDGGRVLFLIIEKIKGKPVKREVEAVIHNVGFFILIAIVIIVTYRDIIKLF